MTLWNQKDTNIRKTVVLFTAFLVIVVAIGYVFAQAYQSPVILYVAVIFSVFMNVAAYWWSDKLVLRMAKAVPIEEKDNRELYHVVENLAIAAGLPTPKIYLIDQEAPNAFATGRDPKHAVVAVTRGLLERLNKTELEGVLAHELSHIGNRDMLFSTVIVVLVGFIAILSDIFRRSVFFGAFRRRNDREGNAGAVLFLVGLVLSIIAPIAAMLMQLALSRKREFLADTSGALLTRYPEGLVSALKKIAMDPTPLPVANNTTAHLWFENPFRTDGKVVKGLSRLFLTHPPVEDRIKALEGLQV